MLSKVLVLAAFAIVVNGFQLSHRDHQQTLYNTPAGVCDDKYFLQAQEDCGQINGIDPTNASSCEAWGEEFSCFFESFKEHDAPQVCYTSVNVVCLMSVQMGCSVETQNCLDTGCDIDSVTSACGAPPPPTTNITGDMCSQIETYANCTAGVSPECSERAQALCKMAEDTSACNESMEPCQYTTP